MHETLKISSIHSQHRFKCGEKLTNVQMEKNRFKNARFVFNKLKLKKIYQMLTTINLKESYFVFCQSNAVMTVRGIISPVLIFKL